MTDQATYLNNQQMFSNSAASLAVRKIEFVQFFVTYNSEDHLPAIERALEDLHSFDEYYPLREGVIGALQSHCDRESALGIKNDLELELGLVNGLEYKVKAYVAVEK